MKHTLLFLVFLLIINISSFAFSAVCDRCNKNIADDRQYCAECISNVSSSLSEMKVKEGQIARTMQTSRENYKKALQDLIQHYLNTGNQSRLEQARKELKALNKVPQLRYLTASEDITIITPSKNIEDANILFHDGMTYKKMLNIIKRKTNLSLAAARFRRILNKYPESDKADDAAYELADILEKSTFKNYEEAAYYYVKCYELNPNTEVPAHYKAAKLFDEKLQNFQEAVKNYELALKTSKYEKYRKDAKTRIDILKKVIPE